MRVGKDYIMINNHRVQKLVDVSLSSFNFYSDDTITNLVLDAVHEVISKEPGLSEYLKENDWLIMGYDAASYFMGNRHEQSCDLANHVLYFMIPFDTPLTIEDIRFIVYHEFGHLLDLKNGRYELKVRDDNDHDVFFDGVMIDNENYYRLAAEIANNPEFGSADYEYHSMPEELSANLYAFLNSNVIPHDISLKLGYDIAKEHHERIQNLPVQ